MFARRTGKRKEADEDAEEVEIIGADVARSSRHSEQDFMNWVKKDLKSE